MHTDTGPEWEAVIQGCRRWDRQSQQALYRLYYAYGMSICIRYADQEDEAIQILNDGFMKVFTAIKRYDQARPFKAWFRKILVNTAINHLQKYKKFKQQVSMEEASGMQSGEDILSRLSYEELIGIVQLLSTAYRTVFNLYVIDGFSHEEIAQRLGISVGTSKSNLAKARIRLKALLLEKLNIRYA